MTPRSVAAVALLALGVVACGRYGPPVREPASTGSTEPADADEERETDVVEEEASTEPTRP